MIAKSFVATTRLSASSLSGLLFLIAGAGRVSIVSCCAGAATTPDLDAADLNTKNQRKAQGVKPAKKSFALFSHQFLPQCG